jgi:hypothetical protein
VSLDVDLQFKLSALAGAGVPVQQNFLSVDQTQPHVWYQRQSGASDLLLSGAGAALGEDVYAVEVAGMDPDAAAAIAGRIKATYPAGMDGFRGQMGPQGGPVVLGCFVEDAADDYQPRSLELDDGYHVFAFNLRILT